MKSQLFEEASQVITDPQLLINVVSKRVRQLGANSRPLVEVEGRMGLMEIALAEIARGKIGVVHTGDSGKTED
ncbi:MAG: hypothetical protein Fur0032_02210 [Terrimicrobiaceae bacterium]